MTPLRLRKKSTSEVPGQSGRTSARLSNGEGVPGPDSCSAAKCCTDRLASTAKPYSLPFPHGAHQGHEAGWVLEADLKSFFGSLDHDWVLRFVEHRVGDPRLISFDPAVVESGRPGRWSRLSER